MQTITRKEEKMLGAVTVSEFLQKRFIEAGKATLSMSLEQLIDQMEVFDAWDVLTHYEITENFSKYGLRTYQVVNLAPELDEERGVVFFDDMDQTFLQPDNTYVLLHGLCVGSILDIVNCSEEDGNWVVLLVLEDGYIKIDAQRKVE